MLIFRNFDEKVERHAHRIDYAGAVLLTSSLTLLILGLLEGGQAWEWNSPTSLAIFAVGIVLFAAFLMVERRAAEPVLPLWAFSRPLLLTTTLLAFAVGAVLIGLTSYIPTYLESASSAPRRCWQASRSRPWCSAGRSRRRSPGGCICGSASGRRC